MMTPTIQKTRLYVILAVAFLTSSLLKAETDVTFLLTNPGFDTDSTGWHAENLNITSTITPYMYPRTAYSACELWSCTGDVYQILRNVPNGRYTVSCQGFFRDGTYMEAEYKSKNKCGNITAMLYANKDSMPLADVIKGEQSEVMMSDMAESRLVSGKYIPNAMESARKYFDKGLYNNSVTTTVTDGKLRIGVRANACIPSAWYVFDNFKITYNGKLKRFKNQIKSKLEKETDGLKERSIAIRKVAGTAMNRPAPLDSINTAYQKSAAMGKVDDHIEKEIVAGYRNYKELDSIRNAMIEKLTETETRVNGLPKEPTPESSVKAIMSINKMDSCIKSSNIQMFERAKTYINVISDLSYLKARKDIDLSKASPENPIDVTANYMRNPDFDTPTQWNYEDVSNHAYPRINVKACEYWSSTSDTYQILTDLPNGEYIIRCQGFYRDGTVQNNFTAYCNGKDKVMAVLYAGTVTQPLMNIMKSAQLFPLCQSGLEAQVADVYIPHTMPAAYVYFHGNRYENSLKVKVTDGTLRIGVRCDKVVPDSWYIFSGFKLLYCGE